MVMMIDTSHKSYSFFSLTTDSMHQRPYLVSLHPQKNHVNRIRIENPICQISFKRCKYDYRINSSG
jgi:hypothetical protein